MLGERLLRAAIDRLFGHLEVEPRWLEDVGASTAAGPVVYVLRHVSALDFLALEHVTRRHGKPVLGFANDLPPLFLPGHSLLSRSTAEPEALMNALRKGQSAALFLQRAPERPGAAPKMREGSALLKALIDLQRERPDQPISFVPLLFVWSRRSEVRGFSLVDSIFGPADFPGEFRQLASVISSYNRGELRTAEPMRLPEFLGDLAGESDDVLVRRLGYALLRKLDRERRTIVGPARKASDRMREEVLRSPKLQSVIKELAASESAEVATLEDKARGMLAELMTVPGPQTAKGVEAFAATVLERVYSGIDVDEEGIERIREAARVGSVVLLPSHKSHVDYIVLSSVLRRRALQLPVIAAGDNLSFFPVGPILRRSGAFFIRRSFKGDRLYTAIVDAYIRRLLREGWILEFFMEGGRSRTGKLLPPMLGLLSMVVSAALPLERRKVTFFPISIGYERLMEESSFARELSGGSKQREDASQLLAASRVLVDRWGRVNIQVGRGIEFTALRDELGVSAKPTPAKRRELIRRLAYRAMDEINQVTLVTPGALVALVLLGNGRRGMAYRELLDQCLRVAEVMRRGGARIGPALWPRDTTAMREQGIVEALKLYVRSGLIEQHVPGDIHSEQARRARLYTGTDVVFTIPDNKRVRLDFLKNHILHFLVNRALVSTALTCGDERGAIDAVVVKDRVLALSRMFKLEFMFRADAPFDRIFDDTIAAMLDSGELAREDGAFVAGPGHDGLDGSGWLTFYAATMRNFIEAYVVAGRSLEVLLKGPASKKDLQARALKIGQPMVLRGELERAEAIEKPLLENAFEIFVDQGYLIRENDGYALAPPYASASGVHAIEAGIAAFLPVR